MRTSPTYPIATTSIPKVEGDQPTSKKSAKSSEVRANVINGFIALFTLGLLVVAGSQLAMFRRQLEMMQASVEDSKTVSSAAEASAKATAALVETNQMSMRAWLSTEGAPVSANNIGGTLNGTREDFTVFAFLWRNGGQTAAKNCKLFTKCAVVDASENVPVFEMTPGQAPAAIFIPGAIHKSANGIIGKRDLERIKVGEKRGFIYGFIQYNDVFSAHQRHTECCFEISYGGVNDEGKDVFNYAPIGPQNTYA